MKRPGRPCEDREPMRNRYPGICYRCGNNVPAGKGHFEKIKGTKNGWRVQHASCAIQYRGTDHQFTKRRPSSTERT